MLNSIKTQASVLSGIFKSHGIELSRGKSLDYLAKIYGLPDFNSLSTHTEPLSKEIQNLLGKSYRAEDQLRMNGSAAEIAVGLTLKEEGASLEEVSWEIAKAGFELNRNKPGFLHDVEIDHAERCGEDLSYGPESVVRTTSGFSLATDVYPNEVTYLRVVDPKGVELTYWNTDEILEDPGFVLGAIIGALRPSGSTFKQSEGKIASSVEVSAHAIKAASGYVGLDYIVDSVPVGHGNYTGTYVDFSLYLNVDEEGCDDGSDVKVHMFIDCQENRLCIGDIGYSPSREDDYEFFPLPEEARRKIESEITKPGVLEATASSILQAIQKHESRYTGPTFSIDDFKEKLLTRFSSK